MAVIDADEEAVGVVVAGDRLAQLRRVDLISRFGCRVNVSSAHQSSHHFAIAEEQTTTFAGRGLACVRDDLVPDLSRQDEPHTSAQRPPAIAGMTMTSLPSGTAAPLPPRVRASSSPM